MVQDARGNTRAGTIGATSVDVPATVKGTVNNYLINDLYGNFKVNVKPAGELPGGKGSASSFGADKLVASKITGISIQSFDAIMEPVHTQIHLNLSVYDAQGTSVYEHAYTGLYEERIGISLVDSKTGQLVEQSIKFLMGQITGDDALKKALESK